MLKNNKKYDKRVIPYLLSEYYNFLKLNFYDYFYLINKTNKLPSQNKIRYYGRD